MAEAAQREADERGCEIAICNQHEHEARVRRDQHDRRGDEDEDRVGAPRLRVERLEAAEPDRAHHERRRHDHHGDRRQRRAVVVQTPRIRIDSCRGNRGGRRTRQADEISLVAAGARALDVEAREAHRGGGDEEKPGRPSEAAERGEPPRERQDRRRDAERDDVRERVELDAELARRAGHPRNAAVEHVEHDGEADERRGRLVLAAHRVDDARVPAEHVAHRQQAGQQVDAATQPIAARAVARAPQEPQPTFAVIEHRRSHQGSV